MFPWETIIVRSEENSINQIKQNQDLDSGNIYLGKCHGIKHF